VSGSVTVDFTEHKSCLPALLSFTTAMIIYVSQVYNISQMKVYFQLASQLVRNSFSLLA
jgi:hypothetical protein